MKRIITVQDLIDELMLVVDKDARIDIVATNGEWEVPYHPEQFDFSIADFTDIHTECEVENRVVLRMYY